MNQEQLHDALNLLDEDMIETVDALRHRKPRRSIHWKPLISAAACVCIALLGVLSVSRFGILFPGSENDKAQQEENFPADIKEEVKNESSVLTQPSLEQEELSSITHTEDGEKMDNQTENSMGEVPSVLVKIGSWQENGFHGTVEGIVDTEILALGTEVTVYFVQDVEMERLDGDEAVSEHRMPDSHDFPVGSVVRVQFFTLDHTDNKQESGNHSDYVLYAESIAMADMSAE